MKDNDQPNVFTDAHDAVEMPYWVTMLLQITSGPRSSISVLLKKVCEGYSTLGVKCFLHTSQLIKSCVFHLFNSLNRDFSKNVKNIGYGDFCVTMFLKRRAL